MPSDRFAPNMALQRTPRPRFLKVRSGLSTGVPVQGHAGTGRSLRSLGAPLNARPLGAQLVTPRPWLFLLLFILAPAAPLSAGPAVGFSVVSNHCALGPCPCCIQNLTTVASGTPFLVAVVAIDAANSLASGYLGTISFSSTDPLATLPPAYSFLPSDDSRRGFTAILRTPGVQQITVTDSAGALTPGVLVMTVTGPLIPDSIPTTSDGFKVLLTVGLVASAFWILKNHG
jgi:hypothetical protein